MLVDLVFSGMCKTHETEQIYSIMEHRHLLRTKHGRVCRNLQKLSKQHIYSVNIDEFVCAVQPTTFLSLPQYNLIYLILNPLIFREMEYLITSNFQKLISNSSFTYYVPRLKTEYLYFPLGLYGLF
jgi:hypothetical protein